MPQKITKEMLESASSTDLNEETIPSLEDAKHYFAFVNHNGAKILCILDGGTWRPTNYQEMMGLM